ncbi:hypothetical protein C2S53_015417 [Perilla frutescens var. hirtella]|uniref:Uncharacterized protein n=1 Tax=Perilla frutescens var. hirtella TaxID=608512 RepID=A0AAD4J5U0_PERFH|nr:hypothetical protein C2S51_019825 [Perilla frutescens var. frutescens]KAH6827743.1 hypothetical protein C2S53_015417 [Perilla frutescens var. hirtella]
MVDGCDSDGRTAKTISGPGYSYAILEKIPPNKFLVQDTTTYEKLEDFLSDRNCDSLLRNLSMPQIHSLSFTFSPNISLFTCFNQTLDDQIQDYFRDYSSIDSSCGSSSRTVYYNGINPTADREGSGTIPTECSMTQLPLNPLYRDSDDLRTLLLANFTLEWSVPRGCFRSRTLNEYGCKQGII